MASSAEIPYGVVPRPDTGFTNGKLGMGLFLAADTMLFAGLLSSYVLLRVNGNEWPPPDGGHPSVVWGGIGAILLLAVSGCMFVAGRSRQPAIFIRFRWLASVCGLLFIVAKAAEYHYDLAHGLHPATNTYLGMYFALTGVHAVHVLGGALGTLVLAARDQFCGKADLDLLTTRNSTADMYLHFLTGVWIVLFAVFYWA